MIFRLMAGPLGGLPSEVLTFPLCLPAISESYSDFGSGRCETLSNSTDMSYPGDLDRRA